MTPDDPHDGSAGAEHHFTYRKSDGPYLCQGDLLRKTPRLVVLLKRQYPRFAISRYTHFLVLTQSCDLVLRSGVCKASHVSLAAVVPLQLVLETRIRAEQDEFERAAGVGSSKLRGELRQFLERLLNNNEPDSFYLHEDSGLGLAQGSCAFLRLSIPVEAVPNYDLLLESRILSLTDGFQAKLGWLTGNLSSRVGTEDWVPRVYRRKKEFDDHIGEILNKVCEWFDHAHLEEARRTWNRYTLPPNSASRPRLLDHINQTQVVTNRARAIQCVLRALTECEVGSPDFLRRVERTLQRDPEFRMYVK